jgi:hypothetical protein
MEQKFLLYVLYITLVEIREQAYEKKDNRLFWLCDMLHNIPFALTSEDATKEAYNRLLESVKHLGVENWLEHREKEFYSQFPEYKKSN